MHTYISVLTMEQSPSQLQNTVSSIYLHSTKAVLSTPELLSTEIHHLQESINQLQILKMDIKKDVQQEPQTNKS